MSFAEKDLILKMDTEASSTIETGVEKGHKGFHMQNSPADKWHIFWNLEVGFKLFFLMNSCSPDIAFQESD